MREPRESTSRFLSFVLRHEPGAIGLRLDREGWANIEELVACAAAHRRVLTRELIAEVVRTNDKQRFALDVGGTRIRAVQGHSIEVDLGLAPVEPPDSLFHGTAARSSDSIRRAGIKPGDRQYVHLSGTAAGALRVGARHGRPIVLRVRALAMHARGHVFHLSENHVWLTRTVPVEFVEFPAEVLTT